MRQKRTPMFTNWSAITISIFALAMHNSATASSNTGDAEEEKITTPCQEAAFALKIADTYERLAKEKTDTANPLQEQAAKWTVAAAHETDPEKAALLAILAQFATASAFNNLNAAKDSSASLITAANKWRERGALLLGRLNQSILTRSSDDNPFQFGSTTSFKLRTGTAKDKATECTEQLQKDATTAAVLTPQAYGKSGLKKLVYFTDDELAKLTKTVTATVTAGATCVDTPTNKNWGQQIGSCSGVGSGTRGSGVTIQETSTSPPPKPAMQDIYSGDTPTKCKQGSLEENDKSDPLKVLLHATCQAQEAAAGKTANLEDINPDSLSEDPNVIAAVRNSHPNFMQIADTTKDSDINELKEYVKKAYDKEANKFKTEFIDNINKKSISYCGPKATEKTTIGDLALKAEAAAAIAYFQRKKFLAAAASLPATEREESEAKDNCKPDTEENECKKNKDCEQKDGKCKAKEGVKVENDVKPTNTTGSNSFVINKAPLLLAVLSL
uniref:Variant surface glycoprotein 1125.1738 n=1 Tax=Trypanosoma brucei TaxID=5691 RepID=A0A1J0R7M6_9TRYP|nr:variant surface glycoprotein 1125.1738 [Trypanosoma brucei]